MTDEEKNGYGEEEGDIPIRIPSLRGMLLGGGWRESRGGRRARVRKIGDAQWLTQARTAVLDS